MSEKKSKIRIALLQFSCVDGEVHQNYKTLQNLLKKLASPVDLIVLPEMWPSGFRVKEGKILIQETREVIADLSEFAKKKKTYLVTSHLEQDKKGFYNSAVLIGPSGKVFTRYHKVHLFQLGAEDKKFVPGKKVNVVKTPLGCLGLSICYDMRFPELTRKQALAGAEILVIPSAWPKVRIDHYLTLLKARAIENLCFVISANKVGKNAEDMLYGGHSIAYDPWGKKLGELNRKEGILQVTLDLKQLHQIRKSFPVFEARREEVY